jgi:hypothetical protein
VKPGKCRGCGGAIIRGETYAGKPIVVEPEPSPAGTVRLFGDGRAVPIDAAVLADYRAALVPLHALHRHR